MAMNNNHDKKELKKPMQTGLINVAPRLQQTFI